MGKKPILKNWPTRFLKRPLRKSEIVNGIIESDGKIISYDGMNIGIVTGKVSNCIVLDIDDLSALEKLKKLGDLPLTWKVRSNRGIHLYFNYNDTISSMKIWNSIDILSDKKQVVAPPSVHPSGSLYRWVLSPKQIEKADLPMWLVKYLIEYNNQNSCDKPLSKKINIKKLYNKKNAFNRDNINNLLNRVDWVDYFSRFTTNITGNGEWLSCKCPFHDDKHNSFSFNKNHGGWKCFAGCGSGNGIQAVQLLSNTDFRQAILILQGDDIFG